MPMLAVSKRRARLALAGCCLGLLASCGDGSPSPTPSPSPAPTPSPSPAPTPTPTPPGFDAPSFYPTARLSGERALDLEAGDFNGDGLLDLLVNHFDSGATPEGRVVLLAGGPAGTFAAPVVVSGGDGRTGYRVDSGDLNGDGRLDFVVQFGQYDQSLPPTSSTWVKVQIGNGNGTFAAPVYSQTQGQASDFALFDVSGDGRLDLVTSKRIFLPGAADAIYRVAVSLQAADGTFAPEVEYTIGAEPAGLTLGDFNGDNRADVAVTHTSGVSILLNNGSGGFGAATEVALAGGARVVAAGDLNGDGRADLAVGRAQAATVTVILSAGNGTFSAPQDLTVFGRPLAIVIADLNRDGTADIMTTAEESSPGASLLANNGSAQFQVATRPFEIPLTYGLVAADFDRDGIRDVAALTDTQLMVALGR